MKRTILICDPDTTTRHLNPIYEKPDWAKGYDVIVHDECSSDVKDLAVIGRILEPHRQGLPAVLLHCGMHCYRSEGFPNAVMEAMGAGVAVVATAVGGVTEMIEDGSTGFLVPARNAEALADRILLVLTDAGKREAVASRGRQFVMTRLGMAQMVEAVEKLYAGLMLERSRQ